MSPGDGPTVVIVAGWLRVAPDRRDAYLDGCRRVVEAARAAPGCLDFALSADLLDPGRVDVHERWASAEDLARFRGTGPDAAQATQVLDAEVRRYTVASAGPA